MKRLNWPLGRIIEIFPGRDGKVRVVKLKTATGYLTRPVQRLYHLELSTAEDAEQSEEIEQRYKRTLAAPDSKSRADERQVAPRTPEVPEKMANPRTKETPEKRTRSGRKVIAPVRLGY